MKRGISFEKKRIQKMATSVRFFDVDGLVSVAELDCGLQLFSVRGGSNHARFLLLISLQLIPHLGCPEHCQPLRGVRANRPQRHSIIDCCCSQWSRTEV